MYFKRIKIIYFCYCIVLKNIIFITLTFYLLLNITYNFPGVRKKNNKTDYEIFIFNIKYVNN